MPNIASALKDEISRLARKSVRQEIQSLKKASSNYRSDIASLKRTVTSLERLVRQATKEQGQGRPSGPVTQTDVKHRYSAKRLAAHRAKLGLSAADYGRLCGVSGQTIYNWEAEGSRPRQAQLNAIAAIRGIGKREASARLSNGES